MAGSYQGFLDNCLNSLYAGGLNKYATLATAAGKEQRAKRQAEG
jgi:hypothetical protein